MAVGYMEYKLGDAKSMEDKKMLKKEVAFISMFDSNEKKEIISEIEAY